MVKSTGACMRHQDHYNDQMTNENVEHQHVGMCVMKLSGLTSWFLLHMYFIVKNDMVPVVSDVISFAHQLV